MSRSKEFDYLEKLSTVRDLFWAKGYYATSLHDIVDKMKLNRSSIYQTYGNKRDLFLKCLEDYSLHKIEIYKNASQIGTSPLEKIERIIRNVVLETIKDDKSCMIVKSIYEFANKDEDVNQIVRNNSKEIENVLLAQIVEAEKKGEITSTMKIDPIIISRFIISGITNISNHYFLSRDAKETESMIQFLMHSIRR